MIIDFIYSWRDMIFTIIEILFLLYLLNDGLSSKEKRKKIGMKIFMFILFFLWVVGSSSIQMNLFIKVMGQVALIIIIGIIGFEISFFRSVRGAFIYMLGLVLGEIIAIFVFGLLGIDGIVSVKQNEAFTLSMLVVSKIIILSLILFLNKVLKFNYDSVRDTWLVLASNFSIIIVFGSLEYTLIRQNELLDKDYSSLMLISFLLLILVMVFNTVLWTHLIRLKEVEKNEAIKRDELRIKSEYYYEKAKNDEEIREIYHDLKQHMILLKPYGQTDEFAERLERKIDEYSCFFNTGNDYLDILLKDKISEMEKDDIRWEIEIDFRNTEFIEPLDISTIFGNILDNAMEACKRLEIGDRKINLYAKRKNSMLMIKEENPMLQDGKAGITFRTTKINKNLHGFGLKSICKTVEKYSGTVKFKMEKGIFSTVILLPTKEK